MYRHQKQSRSGSGRRRRGAIAACEQLFDPGWLRATAADFDHRGDHRPHHMAQKASRLNAIGKSIVTLRPSTDVNAPPRAALLGTDAAKSGEIMLADENRSRPVQRFDLKRLSDQPGVPIIERRANGSVHDAILVVASNRVAARIESVIGHRG